jgi:hypothetical protein
VPDITQASIAADAPGRNRGEAERLAAVVLFAGSATAKEPAQPAALADGGLAGVAWATLGGRDAGHNLADVLAAAGPGDLAALLAGDGSAHEGLLMNWFVIKGNGWWVR